MKDNTAIPNELLKKNSKNSSVTAIPNELLKKNLGFSTSAVQALFDEARQAQNAHERFATHYRIIANKAHLLLTSLKNLDEIQLNQVDMVQADIQRAVRMVSTETAVAVGVTESEYDYSEFDT